jgi:hypothetical protein
VVDPTLTGKVKITVIATGFGAHMSHNLRPSASSAQTPVDMSPYTEVARLRAEPAPATAASPRLSIARRALLDLPMAAAGGGAPVGGPDGANADGTTDADLGSTFDVPAFLRRQEG